ncbi:MAG: DUF1819 family protein [Candidatus Aminicenantes bacterium]|nr:DUF1819 family protein [Candidatus Aminicenantes bacterium]NIM79575.1 DUF1819 family protein [Candidatus Aminicenantes bacterium]NIN18884.1 DUF1819 family protein [Candidatus Aminicenantes bacterium]NIN42794.1 DUF1819 family protein [Candidatus Aminicenantes bacterium]NIN85521.1 DUF1819 family protein [Candidatus Aminicenantes bacterium]
MRLLVQNWAEDASWNEQRKKIILENTLGKKTKKRIIHILNSIFYPRFLKGNPLDAWKLIRPLEDNNLSIEVLKPVYYWVSCRSDLVLYEYVLEEMFPKCKSLDLSVRMEETISWVKKKLEANNQEWSESVTERVAWGILAALRDFGILEGTKKKKVAPVYLPLEAFVYLAFTLYKLGSSGERLVNHPDWKLFLIDTMVVERLFLEAHQNKMLHYQSAGKIYRIEFPVNNWEGMADVISGRAN